MNPKITHCLVLALLCTLTNAHAQNTQASKTFLFEGGKTLWELEKQNLVKDKVMGGEKYDELLFLDMETPTGNIEYFKQDDSTYVARIYQNGKKTGQGTYRADYTHLVRIDTIITFDPETLLESMYVVERFKLEKDGAWNELDAEGNPWRGSYQKGKRTGGWYQMKAMETCYISYEDGLPISYHSPRKEDITAHLDWLTESPLHLCEVFIEMEGEKVTKHEWALRREPSTECEEAWGVFTFRADGSFQLQGHPKGSPLPRKGKWRLNERGDLELSNKKYQDRFYIRYFGKTLISLVDISPPENPSQLPQLGKHGDAGW